MIGTVIGFMLMLSGFSSVNFADVSSVQSLIATLSSGMSTSLSTTLVGLTASVILKLQFFGLEKALEDKRNKGKIL
jgi:biopolymer transport protein ExbB/TolQ